MRYLLDADWIIHALAGRADVRDALIRLAPEGIAVSWITAGEVLEGALGARDPERHVGALRRFLEPFVMLGLDEETMGTFARTRLDLRRRGELIPDFDILLAGTALRHDLAVLTHNIRHLGRIPELQLYRL